MDIGITAGILGNLKFDPSQHTWAVEVGQFLAMYELLLNDSEHDRGSIIVQRRSQVLREINFRLSEHCVFFQIPDNPNIDRILLLRVIDHTLSSLEQQASPAHCAFALIGDACGLLREGLRFATDEQKDGVTTVAFNRIQEIRNRCATLKVKIDLLWEVIRKEPADTLTTPFLLQLFDELGKPLKILMLCANPDDTSKLLLSEERSELINSLRNTRFQDAFEVQNMPNCRVRDINRSLLEHEPTILHFSGHGDSRGLVFSDDCGQPQIVQPQDLARLFSGYGSLKLAVLNACYTHTQAQTVANAVGFAIGMEKEILDKDAIIFTREFYTTLGFGRPLQSAFELALNAVHLDPKTSMKAHFFRRLPHL